jgi:hypothetical protein
VNADASIQRKSCVRVGSRIPYVKMAEYGGA